MDCSQQFVVECSSDRDARNMIKIKYTKKKFKKTNKYNKIKTQSEAVQTVSYYFK